MKKRFNVWVVDIYSGEYEKVVFSTDSDRKYAVAYTRFHVTPDEKFFDIVEEEIC